MKAIEKDAGTYRLRRGKLVKIPEGWLGNITTDKTISQRPSKLSKKVRRLISSKAMYVDKKDNDLTSAGLQETQ